MADLQLKSERQIQTEILSDLIATLGLNDVNAGSVIDRLTQAFAQQNFHLYFQIAQLSRLGDIDALTGDDLDLKAFEYGITRQEAVNARGTISILRDANFEKVSTTFYAGSPAAIENDTQIDVNDASNALIGTSGTLILGRGTNNEEEVTYSAAPVNNTNFYRFTLDAPLTNDHAIEETVILKQGNDEIILAGTVVVVPATGTTAEIQFKIDNDVTLQAGEDKVQNVEVTADLPGTDGNIAICAIEGEDAFPSPPFIGARAKNEIKYTTGKDRQTDDELRDEIKSAVQSLSKGVKEAILNAIVGLVDPNTAKRVVSASVVLPVDECGPVKIYIDDGLGFEPTFTAQGFEIIKQNTTGGEDRLQLDEFPIAKAQIENNIVEPYDLSSGALTLEYTIGTENEIITFNPADFRFSDIATAEEVAAAINDKATLIEARTSQIGKQIVITARRDVNEAIQVSGGTSNSVLGFPTDRKETLNLYKDDVRLSKDGETAFLDSGNTAPFNLSAVGAFPHTLTMIVDKKSANSQTATIALADVADPAAVTVDEIAAVINRDIAGITAFSTSSGTRLRLESNTKLSSASAIQITGGSANNATNGLNFSTTEKVGVDGDYTFNRELGIIQLNTPAGLNQTFTAGSLFTRGKLRATSAELYSPANGETLVISVDGGADQTVTFDATFSGGQNAIVTAAFINSQLSGATAIVRTVGAQNFIEINTNTYATSGSIEIKSSSTGNGTFQFPVDTVETSGNPNQAFQVSGLSSPYQFAEGDSLVVVVDNDIVNNTFSILMNYASDITAATSTTVFTDSAFINIFDEDDELIDYYLAFTAGANTDTGTITTIADIGSGQGRYTFDTAPATFANYASGDLFSVEGLADSSNNGKFVIQAVGANFVDVLNADVVNATSQTGSATISLRRQITDYNNTTGQITVGTAFTNTPTVGDTYIVIPSTVTNLVKFINNTKVTSFSLKGIVEGVDNNSKLQLSSKASGSDGYIQVTGGQANEKLGFDTATYRGLQAYNYWEGLIDLVHRTIYGDDTDLVSFPGVGAAGITFQILAPTVKEISVEMDVTLTEGVSIASLENEIKSAVTGYVILLGVGDDIIIEEIRAAVIRISGITDVVISLPTENIPIADNELGRVSEPNILIG